MCSAPNILRCLTTCSDDLLPLLDAVHGVAVGEGGGGGVGGGGGGGGDVTGGGGGGSGGGGGG